MSFTEHNSFPMMCLDLAQYVVHMMSARALADKTAKILHENCPF